MSHGENDHYEEVRLQMEIDPTEISQGDNDDQEVQRLGAKLSDGAQKTQSFFSSPCIYRVPEQIRKLNESAYTPRLIAIGPLHQNDKHLQSPMQHVKLSYANNLLCRVAEGENTPEEVTLDVEMLLIDGCFILELLYRSDCVFLSAVDKVMRPEREREVEVDKVMRPEEAKRYLHILHKLHDDYVRHDQTGKEDYTEVLSSASKLDYAGVKLVRRRKNELFTFNFTELEGLRWWYSSARFEIPYIEIDDSTESVLRNLIAFEQCCPGISRDFTSYAIIMDMLVKDNKDVQVLEEAGVVRQWLGADKVADLFNNLPLRREYFANPWSFITFFSGFVALGITVAQFFLSFLQDDLFDNIHHTQLFLLPHYPSSSFSVLLQRSLVLILILCCPFSFFKKSSSSQSHIISLSSSLSSSKLMVSSHKGS